jgi:hypothetical protein
MWTDKVKSWWRRLLNHWPWRRRGLPVWGEGSPKVLGVCKKCGAMVMEGWHHQLEDGYLCRRCAGQEEKH